MKVATNPNENPSQSPKNQFLKKRICFHLFANLTISKPRVLIPPTKALVSETEIPKMVTHENMMKAPTLCLAHPLKVPLLTTFSKYKVAFCKFPNRR